MTFSSVIKVIADNPASILIALGSIFGFSGRAEGWIMVITGIAMNIYWVTLRHN